MPSMPPEPLADYRAPGPASADEDRVRRLALAWASLAARRDPTGGARRVTVLRPFVVTVLGE